MPIITIRHNENNRSKRKAKETKIERRKGVVKVIVKV